MSPVQILQNTIAKHKADIRKLEHALAILQDHTVQEDDHTPPEQSAPIPAPLPARAAEQTVAVAPLSQGVGEVKQAIPPKPTYTGPYCGACNGKMYQTARSMPSGAIVSLYKCNDSACGNEVYN